MTEYVLYTTVDGDRWDTISQRMYGSPWRFEAIIAANPAVPIRPVLPGGIQLWVPVVPVATDAGDDLPPWKQQS